MPGPDRAEPDPRIVMLRRMIDGIEDGAMGRDAVLVLVEATGIEAMLHTARNGPAQPPDTTRVIGVAYVWVWLPAGGTRIRPSRSLTERRIRDWNHGSQTVGR